ncbi:MAG: hypothetical protein AAF635_00175 [Cyanobacteria bacterium P01_C01_bin.69]
MNHMGDLLSTANVRYLTNEAGEKTDVLIPVEAWENILKALELNSGLAPIDEEEPVSRILSDLQTAVREVKLGQTKPVSELWDNIDLTS